MSRNIEILISSSSYILVSPRPAVTFGFRLISVFNIISEITDFFFVSVRIQYNFLKESPIFLVKFGYFWDFFC